MKKMFLKTYITMRFGTFYLLAIFALVGLCFTIPACTDNEKARNYGGTETINLEAGRKVMNVTWKEQNIWVLTRPMHPNDTAETVIFQEKSSYGVYEGKIVLVESK
jgi:hypothetical protein